MTQAENQAVIKRARDILVGKVPMPMEQCHEITKALIYKFISVSDQESEADGDAPFYFCGAAKEYRWDALMSMRLPADAIAGRYRDGLAQIGGRRDIPQAFQGIYQDAGLPCDDAPTVAAFLRAVDAFGTANTETIGDAFEHLLQDTGAQGKAGQFRTPRHIIDFIVDIVNPQSRETILDPACGTGGFLTAAWRHIQRQEGDSLTIPDRNRVAGRLAGYDLAPDMVKLARVNLFLQHNQEPRVEVYDTVSHDGHWNDHYDVILANPPFMSPAGIIKPHSRFYTRAKRTEVLFVDYIASHLNPRGRAGVIVPEGIIFQSQKAYQQLRKLLVEEYLAAVVSLPAGVFQPYSGVKTSILILDKELGRHGDTVGFFKVEQDGFDLGAQRRPVERDDLPLVRAELGEYLRRLRAGEGLAGFAPETGLVVEKSRLAAGGEYNLSGERYREKGRPAGKWPLVALGDICELVRGVTYSKGDEVAEGGCQVLRANNISKDAAALDLSEIKRVSDSVGFSDDKKLRANDIFICMASGSKEHIGKVAFISGDTDYYFGGFMGAVRVKPERVEPGYLFQQLRHSHFNDFLREQIAGANINNLNAKLFYRYEIPLPPLSVQGELVAEVEGYERVIAGARQVVASWRPRVEVRGEWAVAQVKDLFQRSDETVLPETLNGPATYVGLENITQGTGQLCGEVVTANPAKVKSLKNLFGPQDILYGRLRPNLNKVWLADREGFCSTDIMVIRPRNGEVLPQFYAYIFRSDDFNAAVLQRVSGAQLPRINWGQFENLTVPLPPLSVQGELVAGIEEERVRVEAAGELAGMVGGRLRGAVGRVWGE